MTAARPVAADLFEGEGAGTRLIGTRCASCGALYFPQTLSCRNPDCREKAVGPERLPQQGVLYSVTVQRYRPPPLFRMDDWAPYALGLVDLGEGLRVMGMLIGFDPEALAIGLPVRLTTGMLYADEEGAPVFTYMFAPVETPA